MGRPATANPKTTLTLNPDLKVKAMVYAITHRLTLTQLVERSLRTVVKFEPRRSVRRATARVADDVSSTK